jgi:hypothetical protein
VFALFCAKAAEDSVSRGGGGGGSSIKAVGVGVPLSSEWGRECAWGVDVQRGRKRFCCARSVR